MKKYKPLIENDIIYKIYKISIYGQTVTFKQIYKDKKEAEKYINKIPKHNIEELGISTFKNNKLIDFETYYSVH